MVRKLKELQNNNILKNQAGFTLVEAVMAVVIMLITLLGVFSVFTYAVVYNTGNNTRSQALSVLQREIELIRSAKFTPAVTDSTITGGVKAAKNVTSADGSSYKVEVTVDDDPATTGIQTDLTKTIKEITVTVTPTYKVSNWQTAVATSVIIRRVRGN
jgi:type II secretory pathway pseudopilin PulG